MNGTHISEITILGFGKLQDLKYFLFLLFLFIYLLTITGNAVIILLVSTNYRLQSPMYILLGNLSFSDVLLTTNIAPSMLNVTILGVSTVSLKSCIVQYLVYGGSACMECLLLTVMSYDRYLAICNPLHYTTIMDLKLCLYLVLCSWFLGFTATLIPVLIMQTLWFCGPNVIDHFFCDFVPLLELSCSDVSVAKYVVFALSSLATVLPFGFITFTYVCIFMTILRITSVTGRQKTFSTCSSHLAVVCIYYGALFAMYAVPSGQQSVAMKKVVSLMYTVVTPLLNPIIYSLRNQEIKLAIQKYLSVCRTSYRNLSKVKAEFQSYPN
ncbi:olfactory receptor 11A1-like [Aquarana catesbeiana]|uniref:olfactory receptor 11A1-like n=1 Tax=Aquarana catesbeiana TaxID=8400 RepID=UPI003CC9815A